MLLFIFKKGCIVWYMFFALFCFFKVAFWTLAFVFSHPTVHETIMEGIASVFGTAGTKPEWAYLVEEISNVHLSHVMGKAKCPEIYRNWT